MGFKDNKFVKPSKDVQNLPTRHLYFAGLGQQIGTDIEALRLYVQSHFGPLDANEENAGIYMPEDRRYCVVSFVKLEDAETAWTFFQDEPDLSALGASKVLVKYAHIAEAVQRPPEPECTTTTADIVIPGLQLLTNFISEEEEKKLMEEFGDDSAPWKESLSRRVQHYGFTFNYRTIMVDYARPTPAMPESCISLGKHMIDETKAILNPDDLPGILDEDGSMPPLNQLTINEYWPGQGIASHTDTESCFGPIIYIVTIGSGIVMNLTKNNTVEQKQPTNDCQRLQGSKYEEITREEENEVEDGRRVRKYVNLPARSLLILSGEARYSWSHGISPRKFDKIDGSLVARGRRVSFTFRHVVKPGPIPNSQLVSGNIEEEHVVKVYDAIAVHWNHTRGKRKVHWHRVKDFLDTLPPGTLLADVGSGDGKYFGVNPNVMTIGCDRSLKLLEVSHEPEHETFCCDAVKLPFVTGMFDAVICIAVLHHMATIERRFSVISELVRISRVGASIMIQAWALEQGDDSKRVFENQDTYVPWKLNKRFLVPENTGDQQQQITTPTSSTTAGAEVAAVTVSATSEIVSGEQVDNIPKKGKKKEKKKLPEDQDEIIVFERYCHVYKEGELEDLCSRVPGCQIAESGWDRGNWFVRLIRVDDSRLAGESDIIGPEAKLPSFAPRGIKS